MERQKSKENVKSTSRDSETISSETCNSRANAEKLVEDDDPDSFILNRFFHGDVKNVNPNQLVPIPKPRQKKITKVHTQSSSSKGTFDVTSPVALKDDIKFCDTSSVRTYKVISPKRTGNCEKTNVGDIIIHNTPKKVKAKSPETSSSESGKQSTERSIKNHEAKSYIALSKENGNFDGEEIQTTNEVRPKPRKRLLRERVDQEGDGKEKDIDETTVISVESKIENLKDKTVFTSEKITEVVIHKTDKLLLNSLVIHPVVKLHIVDINTGKYFPKSNKNRPVVFYYENSEYDYMSPVMTKPFSLQENRSLYPSWEEPILLNEDFQYFIKESPRIIMFFEILDFLSSSAIKTHSIKNGWHKIAFGFLKLAGPNKEHNLQKKLRLQLYYLDIDNKRTEPHMCSIWRFWKKHKLRKYPSTLYVSVRSVVSPQKVVETFRSKTPVQGERSTCLLANEGAHGEISTKINIITGDKFKESTDEKHYKKLTTNMLKRESDVSRLPNRVLGKLPSFDEGCFAMKFSNNGLYLACAVLQDTIYTVVVYSVELIEEVQKFPGHKGLIYDIDWSQDDSLLLVASADCTVSIWNTKSNKFLQILPHPSFVYTCKIDQEYVVATGCYDKVIRIWVPEDNGRFNLSQELEYHAGYITSLIFNKKSNLLYSSDSIGKILEWSKEDDNWKLNRDVSVLDLQNTVLNQILLFCKERRLLIHSRDSTLRILDLKNVCVLHWLQGSLNRRVQTSCSISPCGTFIICGSENGIINVWMARNGTQIASYLPYPQECPSIHCVQFHPSDNILALSHCGSSLPILLYSHGENVSDNEAGLTIVNDDVFQACTKRIRNAKLTPRRGSIKDDKSFDFKSILDKMDEIIEPRRPDAK